MTTQDKPDAKVRADDATATKVPSNAKGGDASNGEALDNSPFSRVSTSSSRIEAPIEERPPPMFSSTYGQVDLSQDGFNTRAKVASDGRLNIKIDQKSRRFSDLLVPTLKSQLAADQGSGATPPQTPPALTSVAGIGVPSLNVVVHVVGSRGDVQPFIALGKVLKETYGHRIRIATHATFKAFVEENGLEFFDIGGDPAELMAFMVKNPGLMPGMDSLKSGDVGRRRKGMYEIVQGCWRSCFEIGDGTFAQPEGASSSDTQSGTGAGVKVHASMKPFVADAIIANPPSFAHIHCAEKLGIPLHLMFTMPWSATQAFPHPLANIQSSNADSSLTNFVSYALVEMMTWQGLGDIINRFREKTLGLEPMSLMWAPGLADRLRIPYTYCWSPALIPKPRDWGSQISISGFYFLSLASTFSPPADLEAFLNGGSPPVYIGFGSIVVDDPNGMTKLIFEAVRKTGQRALVSKGWGGFGADSLGIPDNVFMLGNVPHDWLFQRVSCVVHHGGAGTTAAGIAAGKPTVVVPFFGDQPFWGSMIARAGAGPRPIPNKQLTADNLAAAITEALEPATIQRAQQLGQKIAFEKGTLNGAQSFHDHLKLDTLSCSLIPRKAAVWRIKRTTIRLSALAATTLSNEGLLDFNELKLYRPREYETETGPWEPITGGASALLGTTCSMMMGVADFPVGLVKAMRVKSMDKKDSPSAELSKTSSASESLLEAEKMAETRVEPGDNTQALQNVRRSSSQSGTATQVGEKLTATKSDNSQRGRHAMADALRGSFSRSRSQSRNRDASPKPHDSHQRSDSSSQVTLDAAVGAGKSIGRIVGAGVKSPLDFTLGIARGFHNAPKLYGDESVRQPGKVTDLQSGLKAAGKEFGYGFYDGITGLVTQPILGARKEGVAGFVKGFGKGIGGVVLKPGAAIWGLPGFTFQGIYQEIQKHFGSSVQNYILAARTTQGFAEWNASSVEERREIIDHWNAIQPELQKQRARHRFDLKDPAHFCKKNEANLAPRKDSRHTVDIDADTHSPVDPAANRSISRESSIFSNKSHGRKLFSHSKSDGHDHRHSMAEHSSKDRSDIDEISLDNDYKAALRHATELSMKTAKGEAPADLDMQISEEEERQLKEAINRSIQDSERLTRLSNAPQGSTQGKSIFQSEQGPSNDSQSAPQQVMEPETHLSTAPKPSQISPEGPSEEFTTSKAEEDIVLKYIQRQSLLEHEYQAKLRAKDQGKEPQ